MLAAWWYLLRGKSQKSNVEGTTLFSSCLPRAPRVNSPQTLEIPENLKPESPTGESPRSVPLKVMKRRLRKMQRAFAAAELPIEKITERIKCWIAHAEHADTYRLRERLLMNFPFFLPACPVSKKLIIDIAAFLP